MLDQVDHLRVHCDLVSSTLAESVVVLLTSRFFVQPSGFAKRRMRVSGSCEELVQCVLPASNVFPEQSTSVGRGKGLIGIQYQHSLCAGWDRFVHIDLSKCRVLALAALMEVGDYQVDDRTDSIWANLMEGNAPCAAMMFLVFSETSQA